MAGSRTIRLADAENLLTLVGELAEIKGDLSVRGAHLINRLCEMMHAQVGITAIMEKHPKTGSLRLRAGVEAGLLDETSQRLLRRYISEIHSKDPLFDAMHPEARRPYTIMRASTIPDSQWYNSEFVNEVKFKMKIDDAIYSDYPLEDLGVSVAFGINRLRGDKPFVERDRRLLQLLNTHLGWFYRQLATQEVKPGTQLTEAARRVLVQLLNGDSEKQIARHVQLSAATVHDHIKTIYRHFGVSSRAELMARFIHNE